MVFMEKVLLVVEYRDIAQVVMEFVELLMMMVMRDYMVHLQPVMVVGVKAQAVMD